MKPIILDDYIAKCCGTCKHSINDPLMCELSFMWVNTFGICQKDYEVRKK